MVFFITFFELSAPFSRGKKSHCRVPSSQHWSWLPLGRPSEILLNMVTTDIHVYEGLAEGWQTIVCFSFSLYTQHNPATPGISKTINTRFYNIHTKLVFSDMLRSQNAISFLLEAHSIIVISFVIKSGYIIHNHMESFVLLMQHQ